jgi:hypothetical protein
MFAAPALATGRAGAGLVCFAAGSVAPTSSGKMASGSAGGGISGFAAAVVPVGESAGAGAVCAARAGRAGRGGRGFAGGVAAAGGRSIPGGSGQTTSGAAPWAEALPTPTPLTHTAAPKETSAHAHTLMYQLPPMTIPLDATLKARMKPAGPAPMAQF